MLTLDSLAADDFTYVYLSVCFAEKVLPIWEKEYPNDMRPREAIESAKSWLKNPPAGAYAAAHDACIAAWTAARAHAPDINSNDAWSAHAAVALAAYAAAAAAFTAKDAADAANADADWIAASNATVDLDAADAANGAARALGVEQQTLIHKVILENLDWIIEYKIQNGQGFAEPHLIFDYLDEDQKLTFLFNPDLMG